VKIDTILLNNEKVNVFNANSIVQSPPFKLVLQCFNELLEKDMTMATMPFRNVSSVLWLENFEKRILGGIVYEIVVDRQEGWIFLSFTDPEFRNQGINTACHEVLYKILRDKGMQSVGSTVSVNNVSRLASAKKVGLEPLYYRMFKKL
jgi:RimJ/RimL family protein N-acetyltransferase